MAQRTVNTDNVKQTATAFTSASNEFNDSVSKLSQIINTYLGENKNEASASVEQEWQNAQANMQKVKEYFEKFGQGLNAQASSLDDTFQGLQWKG